MPRRSSRKKKPVKFTDHATEQELNEEIEILEEEFPERKKKDKDIKEEEKGKQGDKKASKKTDGEEDYEPETPPPSPPVSPQRYESEEESEDEYDSESPPPRRKFKRKSTYSIPESYKRRRLYKETEEERKNTLLRRAEATQNIRRLQAQQNLRRAREQHGIELMNCYRCGSQCHPMASDVVIYKAGHAHPNPRARWALCSAACRRYFRGGCWRCGIPCHEIVFTHDGEKGCENCAYTFSPNPLSMSRFYGGGYWMSEWPKFQA